MPGAGTPSPRHPALREASGPQQACPSLDQRRPGLQRTSSSFCRATGDWRRVVSLEPANKAAPFQPWRSLAHLHGPRAECRHASPCASSGAASGAVAWSLPPPGVTSATQAEGRGRRPGIRAARESAVGDAVGCTSSCAVGSTLNEFGRPRLCAHRQPCAQCANVNIDATFPSRLGRYQPFYARLHPPLVASCTKRTEYPIVALGILRIRGRLAQG